MTSSTTSTRVARSRDDEREAAAEIAEVMLEMLERAAAGLRVEREQQLRDAYRTGA